MYIRRVKMTNEEMLESLREITYNFSVSPSLKDIRDFKCKLGGIPPSNTVVRFVIEGDFGIVTEKGIVYADELGNNCIAYWEDEPVDYESVGIIEKGKIAVDPYRLRSEIISTLSWVASKMRVDGKVDIEQALEMIPSLPAVE